MKIIDIYGLIKPGTIVEIGNQNGDYRSVVIGYYSNAIERFDSVLRFELRALNKAKRGKKNDSKIPPPVSNRRSSPRNKSAVAKQLMNDSLVEKQLKNDSKLHPKKNSPVAKKISSVFEKERRVGNMTWSIHQFVITDVGKVLGLTIKKTDRGCVVSGIVHNTLSFHHGIMVGDIILGSVGIDVGNKIPKRKQKN
jgi:hypothetical protein